MYIFGSFNTLRFNVHNFNDNSDQCPLPISQVNYSKHINLLLITNEDTDHYILVNSLNPFTSSTN